MGFESHLPVDERKVVFVGRLEKDVTKQALGNKFAKFGRVVRVRIHRHDNGTLYGFVTYERARDAWAAVKAASAFARATAAPLRHAAPARVTSSVSPPATPSHADQAVVISPTFADLNTKQRRAETARRDIFVVRRKTLLKSRRAEPARRDICVCFVVNVHQSKAAFLKAVEDILFPLRRKS
ncbi:hypothetical protein PYW07_010208 [Mythimna separata]|uniref:RRM domain-containing protein n=1 Tax=Mythimna separata TaxID=271217 RepID=A0AAD8DQ48_MYTSE|nr:hypothetical protein PYW07_010208 [Mythimna separata]